VTEEKLKLVTRNTEEIVSLGELRKLLKKPMVRAYAGYATTGQMHIGHLLPIIKVIDFLDAGLQFTFLIADLHSFLDDKKTPWKLLDARSHYYETAIKAMLQSAGADTSRVSFVRGMEFQFDKDYVMDILHMAGEITMKRAKRAASEVVRFSETPKLGGFIYPLMQSRDVVALKADIAFGGIDQRGIYMLAREMLPVIGYSKPVCIFTPLLPSLSGGKMGGKMSASEEKSKISITAPEKEVEKRIVNSYCPAKQVKGNWVLMFFKHVVFPVMERKKQELVIERPEKYGGKLVYDSYMGLEKDFASGALHPLDAKKALAKEVNELLGPVREKVTREMIKKAYP